MRLNKRTVVWLVVGSTLIGAGILYCMRVLPPILDRNWDKHGGGYDTNSLGLGMEFVYVSISLLALVVYVAKYWISRCKNKEHRIYLFGMLVVASLPVIWLTIVTDWQNRHVFAITGWLYYPIGLWLMPTISFVVDSYANEPPPLGYYIARSLLELLLAIPLIYAWAFISFFFLGGGWI